MLSKFARSITRMSDMRKLAMKGLHMKLHLMDRHISNHPNDISTAMYHTLNDWRKAQPDNRTAYINLHQALEHAGMRLLGVEIMGGDLEDLEEGKVP